MRRDTIMQVVADDAHGSVHDQGMVPTCQKRRRRKRADLVAWPKQESFWQDWQLFWDSREIEIIAMTRVAVDTATAIMIRSTPAAVGQSANKPDDSMLTMIQVLVHQPVVQEGADLGRDRGYDLTFPMVYCSNGSNLRNFTQKCLCVTTTL